MWTVTGEGWGLKEGGERIVLKSCHGKWMCADNDKLVANRTNVGPWEKFTPIPVGGNVVSLKTAHGKFICAESNGSANCNRQRAQ